MIYFAAFIAAIGLFFAYRYYAGRTWQKGWLIGPFNGTKNYSVNMPLRPTKTATGWTIGIAPNSKVDAVLIDCNGLSGTIRAKYRILGAVKPHEYPDRPTLVSLYFQRKGDDWSAKGDKEYFRWFSRQANVFAEGEGELVIPLDGDFWGSVHGSGGDIHQGRFNQAKADAHRVGIVFGHSSGRSHGVTGAAVFELLEWYVG